MSALLIFYAGAAEAQDTLSIASSASTNEALGSASVVVTRSGSLTSSVSVNYATSNGTASAGQDFTAVSGTLTFAANETSKTITVPLGFPPYYTHECTAARGAKTFSVVLSNPSSNATITNSVSAITIEAVSSTPIQVSIQPTASTSEAGLPAPLPEPSAVTVSPTRLWGFGSFPVQLRTRAKKARGASS